MPKIDKTKKNNDATPEPFYTKAGYTAAEWSERKKFEAQFNDDYMFSCAYEEDLDNIG